MMTLYRQILVMIVVLFTLLLTMVYAIEFTQTRAYLAKQMESDVQNTATSLGLSLVPHLETADRVGVESVVNVVFDGGYYKEIVVQLLATNERVQRLQKTTIEGVPRWFTDLDLFDPVEENNILTSGWMQLGSLKVSGHPGYAYQQLWQLMSQMLISFGVIFVLLVVLVVSGLNHLLKPLRLLQMRAREIETHHFGNPLPEPKILELHGLVKAFNHMSKRLQKQFEQQASEAEDLRRRAYQDEVTQLGNRAYFDGQIEQWLAEPGVGGVILLEVSVLEQVYRDEGYQARDQLIRSVAEVMKTQVLNISGATLSRISLDEIAVILPGIDAEQLNQVAARIVASAENVVINPFEGHLHICSLGGVLRSSEASAGSLLSQADLSLQQARRDPLHAHHIHIPNGKQVVLGRAGWKQLALQAMRHHWLQLQVQSINAIENDMPIYYELFTSIEKEGVRYHARQFMPFVEQYDGLGEQFDRHVLDTVANRSFTITKPLMINLSENAVTDPAFIQWLGQFIEQNRDSGPALAFEVTEECVIKHRPNLEPLFARCHELNIAFGIDRFGQNFEILKELASLHPSYLKIDYGFIHEHEAVSSFFEALVKMAESQEFKIIVTRVESKEQLERLRHLPVMGYQGYIHPPIDA